MMLEGAGGARSRTLPIRQPFASRCWSKHEVFAGKDLYWGAEVIRQAAALGFTATEKGQMIKPENYHQIEQQIKASLVEWLDKAK